MKSINVFVAYAPEDEPFRERLIRHLSTLVEDGLIHQWDASKVMVGQALDETIQQQLQAADIVVFLISADFLASEDCEKIEYQALEYEKTKGTVIAPVIVRPCIFDDHLKRLRLLPDQGRPVTDPGAWSDEDAAWANVAGGLKALVLQLQEGDRTGINTIKPPSSFSVFLKKFGLPVLAVAYLALTFFGIHWLLSPKSSVPAMLDLTTETFAFRYLTSNSGPLLNALPVESADLRDFELASIPANALWLDNGDSIHIASSLDITSRQLGNVSLSPARLNELELQRGNKLSLFAIESEPPVLNIRFSEVPMSVSFTTADTTYLSAFDCQYSNTSPAINKDIEGGLLIRDGGVATFSKADQAILDLTLIFYSAGTVDNKQVFVDSISFYKDNPDDPLALSSGIRSGTISITDWEEIQVAPNYFLTLQVPQRLMLSFLEFNENGLHVQLSGRLEAITAGLTEDDQQNLIPSNIEWMLRNNLISLILYGIALLGFALLLLRFWAKSRK